MGDTERKPRSIPEFEAQYAARSGWTVEALHRYGRRGVLCDCGEEGCDGFQMLHDAWAPVPAGEWEK